MSPNTVRVEQQGDGITIHWQSGHSSFYHYFWLRSACYCEHCGDSLTGSRHLHPSDVPVDIQPATLRADDQLHISWAPDGHASHYDYNWLQAYAYDSEDHQKSVWHPRLWDSKLDLASISHNLADTRESRLAYLEFLRTLRDYGIAIMRGDPQAPVGIETMASQIGDISESAYCRVFDLKPKPDVHTYGNTTQRIPPHTDEAYLHTPAGLLLLYCVQAAQNGGESFFVDGFQVAAQLQQHNPQAYRLLSTCPQTYHRIVPEQGMDLRTRARTLNIDERGHLIGFRFHPRAMAPNDVPGDLARRLHAANFALSEIMLQTENQISFTLQAGDAVFFDNHRVMHSRGGFDDPNRHLQISSISRDRFHQQVRQTAAAQGFANEANQYLPAGVSG